MLAPCLRLAPVAAPPPLLAAAPVGANAASRGAGAAPVECWKLLLRATAMGHFDTLFHECNNKSKCPNRLPECIQHNRKRYAPPRSIAPKSLHRSRPISGATRPRTPANFGGYPPPYPRNKKACSLLVVSVTAPLRSLYIGCLSSCSLRARCLLVAADTSGGLGRECVAVTAYTVTATHTRPNSALRCFNERGLRAGLAVSVCQSVRWLRQAHTPVQTPPSDVFFRNVSTVRKLHRALQARHKRKTIKKSR